MRSTLAVVVGACGWIACGGAVEATSAPTAEIDAGTTGADGGASDAMPSEPVRLLSITPADGELHVSVLARVTLLFSGSLDPSSVTDASVRLVPPNATVAMPAVVTYDDSTHTITLAPKTALVNATSGFYALQNGDVYRVAASGLRAADATPIPDIASSFTTIFGAMIEEHSIDGPTTSDWWAGTADAIGRPARNTFLGISNDPHHIVAYTSYVYRYPTDAGTYRAITYGRSGPDGVWYTADDLIQMYEDRDWSHGRRRVIYYSGPGPDMIWQTPDDAINTFLGYYEVTATPEGLEAVSTHYASLGPDGAAFTSDDVVRERSVSTWTASSGRRVTYSSAGPDATWGTSDDVIGSVFDSVRDSLGRVTAVVRRTAGPDGVWLTSDDGTSGAWGTTFDAKGLDAKDVYVVSPGPDGAWLTDDDVPLWYSISVNVASGAEAKRSFYGAGPDGVWFTSDDVVTSTYDRDPMR
jgi:hypothetical protein